MATNEIPPPAKAADLTKYMTLGEEAKATLAPDMTPDQFLAALSERKLFSDAIQFLAHYLPKRQSIFWAMTCTRQVFAEPTPEAEKALKAAERWIAEPTDENRHAAFKAGEEAEGSTAPGATALAAYYSSGLPQTADSRNNARAYFLSSKLVGGAVLMAATTDREQVLARLESFTAKGTEIAKRSVKAG